MPSIKINFLYKSALTVSTYVIGFITFPYITRVLGVENIGIVNYIDNLTNYFYYLQQWGFPFWGCGKSHLQGRIINCGIKFF